jgi:hypothetical protein
MNNRYSFKRLFWSYTFCAIPFAILGSLLALFNIIPVEFNGSPRYGIQGFIILILYIPFFCLIFSSINWLALSFGGTLYDEFLKMLKRNNN